MIQDRIKLSPEELQSLKTEMLSVLVKYINVDANNIIMDVERQDNMMALIANFPLKNS